MLVRRLAATGPDSGPSRPDRCLRALGLIRLFEQRLGARGAARETGHSHIASYLTAAQAARSDMPGRFRAVCQRSSCTVPSGVAVDMTP